MIFFSSTFNCNDVTLELSQIMFLSVLFLICSCWSLSKTLLLESFKYVIKLCYCFVCESHLTLWVKKNLSPFLRFSNCFLFREKIKRDTVCPKKVFLALLKSSLKSTFFQDTLYIFQINKWKYLIKQLKVGPTSPVSGVSRRPPGKISSLSYPWFCP